MSGSGCAAQEAASIVQVAVQVGVLSALPPKSAQVLPPSSAPSHSSMPETLASILPLPQGVLLATPGCDTYAPACAPRIHAPAASPSSTPLL